MAREIHDTLAQGLTGIITQLQAAQQAGNGAGRERRIDNATRLARDSLTEARRSVEALRPEALEDGRLPEALADEVARWSVTSGVTGVSRPPATRGRCTRRPRSRCCGPRRRRWPTWPSTPAPPGSG